MDELHGRLLWTTYTDLSGVPMYCPLFGRFFVQTALLALDESLDEQEMRLSSCFPINIYIYIYKHIWMSLGVHLDPAFYLLSVC